MHNKRHPLNHVWLASCSMWDEFVHRDFDIFVWRTRLAHDTRSEGDSLEKGSRIRLTKRVEETQRDTWKIDK